MPYTNPYRACWEHFFRHLGENAPYVPTLLEGAKSVQLAELVLRSHAEARWLDVPDLTAADLTV
jgi:predicted dehydrogenase